jgi:hypothetical protein
MSSTTGTDNYAHYRHLCGDAPILTPDELDAALRTAGFGEKAPDEAFWATLFRRPDHQRIDPLAQDDRADWRAGAQAEHDSWQAQERVDRDAWKDAPGEGGQPRWWEAKGRDTC